MGDVRSSATDSILRSFRALAMIIDAWMQHPNAEWIGNPMFESLRRWRPGKWSETAPPIQDTLAEMDHAGVSVGMLCAWHGPSDPMISNDEVAQYCRTYPDRFIGIASVDLFRPMEAVRELRLRVKRDSFKGLRVLPWVWGLPPDDRPASDAPVTHAPAPTPAPSAHSRPSARRSPSTTTTQGPSAARSEAHS